MAAILCQSIGNLFSSCGECLCLPCKACCEITNKVVCSPFFPYIGITMALNIPPAIWGVQSFVNGCDNASWLGINALLVLVHIFACFYIVARIQQEQEQQHQQLVQATTGTVDTSSKMERGDATSATASYQRMNGGNLSSALPWSKNLQRGEAGAANSWKRMGQVMCYDVGVALYIIVALAWIMWIWYGMASALSWNDAAVEGACAHDSQWQIYAIVCGFMYMMLVCVAFACSFICMR